MPDLLLLSEAPAAAHPVADFTGWLAAERLPALLDLTGGRSASLFAIAADEPTNTGVEAMPAGHLTLVENPTAVDLKTADSRRAMLAAPLVGRQYSAMFDRRLLHTVATAEVGLTVDTTGILLVMLNNLLPESDAEFEKWYNTTHVPDVVGAGSYWVGRRFRNDEAGPDEARFLAIYQTSWPDVRSAHATVIDAVPGMRLWDDTEQVHVAVYRKVADAIAALSSPLPAARSQPGAGVQPDRFGVEIVILDEVLGQCRELLRPPESLGKHSVLREFGLPFLRVLADAVDRGVDEAGDDRVDPDFGYRKVTRDGKCESDDPGLGSAVGCLAQLSVKRGDR
jgi:hypothetical protein